MMRSEQGPMGRHMTLHKNMPMRVALQLAGLPGQDCSAVLHAR